MVAPNKGILPYLNKNALFDPILPKMDCPLFGAITVNDSEKVMQENKCCFWAQNKLSVLSLDSKMASKYERFDPIRCLAQLTLVRVV